MDSSEINFHNINLGRDGLLKKLLAADAQNEILVANDQNLEKRKQVNALSDDAFHQYLLSNSIVYRRIIAAIRQRLNLLPASAAIAGLYAANDAARGVWTSPANLALAAVDAPAIAITNDEQAPLNIDAVSGKSINTIRYFAGMGVLVWGARTLDGNSQDWRYINVRRTMMMIEQSVKLACRAYIFEPNTASTWTAIQSMLQSFLTNLWKDGALQGPTAADAFTVAVGLGNTMTAEDIANGILNVSIKVAITHPAEFIVITFQQQQQQP